MQLDIYMQKKKKEKKMIQDTDLTHFIKSNSKGIVPRHKMQNHRTSRNRKSLCDLGFTVLGTTSKAQLIKWKIDDLNFIKIKSCERNILKEWKDRSYNGRKYLQNISDESCVSKR